MNVMIVGSNASYNRMFVNRGFTLVHDIALADLIQFTGGSDVSPHLYGELEHHRSMVCMKRDEAEMAIFNEAIKWNIPVTGICRGGQFLNVMNGGKMYQHVDGHAIGGTHVMHTSDGRDVDVTSTHHQMMRPAANGDVLGYAYESSVKEYMEDDYIIEERDEEEDTEVVYYKGTQSLCFQPHPEFLDKDHECQEYYFELIRTYLGVE